MALSYTSYLQIDTLTQLQKIQSQPPQHDEMLFIVIHQTYELWFKQILHEFDLFRRQLENNESWQAIKTIKRILVIMKTLVGQTDILETMTPLSFNSFRKFLDTASGFQSLQFREIEIICGIRHPHLNALHKADKKAVKIIKEREEESTIWESFITMLQKRGYDVNQPERKYERGLTYDPDPETQEILIEILKGNNELSLLCEHLIDFDEGLQEWRYRHVKMVERTIGHKTGTGGSAGLDYLRKTLHRVIFPDLWAIRTQM
jgi:tryptophan 2,3-dioxygenase